MEQNLKGNDMTCECNKSKSSIANKACIDFLEKELCPQRIRVMSMGQINTFGLDFKQTVKLDAAYTFAFDELARLEKIYSELIELYIASMGENIYE